MTHLSPAVNLVWAILSIALGTFLVFHLWSFDRFKCLKWNHGPHSGAFKRVMTYSYLSSVPLIIIFSVGFAIIKYTYGFTLVPSYGIVPTPHELWSKSAQNAIVPLYLCFSIAWGLEMVTHLEELCFWLFLVNSSSAQQDWFQSPYFKIWALGSCIAVIAMPMVTISTREDVYKCEAFTFLAGGTGSLISTIWFLPVLWTFPSFLSSLKQLDVDQITLLRLTQFHELNCIRVVFRFLFTIPLIILGSDGVRPHQDINDKMLPTDLLGILSSIGCIVSSGITLVIFFPRSLQGEVALKEQQRARRRRRAQESWLSRPQVASPTGSSDARSYMSITHSKSDMDLPADPSRSEAATPVHRDGTGTTPLSEMSTSTIHGLPAYEVVVTRGQDRDRLPSRNSKVALEEMGYLEWTGAGADPGSMSLQPNRRNQTGDVELGAVLSVSEVDLLRTQSLRDRSVSGLVHHWRSPIEIARPAGSSWQRRV